MEKIKTPLMALIKEIDTLRDGVVDLEQIDIFNAYTDLRQMVVKLLPTEREVIEKAHLKGVSEGINFGIHSETPQDYFTQTFKSYE